MLTLSFDRRQDMSLRQQEKEHKILHIHLSSTYKVFTSEDTMLGLWKLRAFWSSTSQTICSKGSIFMSVLFAIYYMVLLQQFTCNLYHKWATTWNKWQPNLSTPCSTRWVSIAVLGCSSNIKLIWEFLNAYFWSYLFFDQQQTVHELHKFFFWEVLP